MVLEVVSVNAPKKTKFEIAVIDRIRSLRIQKGLSQEYIAGLLGLTRSFIGQIESPHIPSKYNLNHLNKLAKEMDCSPQDFIPSTYIEEDDWVEE